MATTLKQLNLRTRLTLGDIERSAYTDYAINSSLKVAISAIQNSVPVDALKPLINTDSTVVVALSDSITLPAYLFKLLSFSATEPQSSGESITWDKVDMSELLRVRDIESNLTHSSSRVRYYTYDDNGDLLTYPKVAVGQTYSIKYIEDAFLTNTITLPDNDPDLLNLTVMKACELLTIGLTDSNIYARFSNIYNGEIAIINNKYFNKYSLSSAEVSRL